MAKNIKKQSPIQEVIIEPTEVIEPIKEPVVAPKVETKTVGAYRLNVRKGPGLGYGIAYELTRGAKVKVLDTKDDWTKIEENEWVMTQYLN